MIGELLDREAGWLLDKLDPKVTRRMSAMMVNVSAVTFLYAPFSGEPPVIYLMSALALLFAALLALVEAQRWTDEAPEDDPDQPG